MSDTGPENDEVAMILHGLSTGGEAAGAEDVEQNGSQEGRDLEPHEESEPATWDAGDAWQAAYRGLDLLYDWVVCEDEENHENSPLARKIYRLKVMLWRLGEEAGMDEYMWS